MRNLIFFTLFWATTAHSQTFRGQNYGLQLGVALNFGTHINAVGVNVGAYYTQYFAQFNANSSLLFNFNALGRRKMFFENRNAIGLTLLAGKRQQIQNFEIDGLYHNTTYNYGVAYNYVFYFDNIGTSQLSGAFGVHLKKVSVLLENDVFAGQAKDRFRTGHLAIQYRVDSNFTVQTGLNIWTGETANSYWDKVSMSKMPSGYRSLEELPYGKTSHGIFYGQITYRTPFLGQLAKASIGIDSEHIRHAFQNRFIHDLIFLPKKVKRNTPHYPRLDENGCAVFEKPLVRNNKFYFQIGSNQNWSN